MGKKIHKLVVGEFQENTWIIVNSKTNDGVIIDPGEEPDRIVGLIRDKSIHPVAILNTHGHLDHIGGICRLKEEYDIPFYLHSADEFLIDEYEEHAKLFGVPFRGKSAVNAYLDDYRELSFAGFDIQVLSTPGHSPGGVTFLIEKDMFVGDTLFAGSIGRVDLPGGDYEILMASITETLFTFDNTIVVHPGHGPDTTLGQEKRNNPFVLQWKR